ncbi:hypothetical protein TNCV_851581 [Trichonephila clavipes]|nr:hypothetical protein TNCV_851581 [Trichonephila clavipes]
MANWSQCEEFPKRKPKKGETIHNRNSIKEPEIKKPSKPVTPYLSFAAILSGAPNKNKIPGTSAASEEAPTTNEKNNENYFGFNDAINELRRFFLDYPFLLEMGRQFRNAKDEERIDIFYQNLVNNYNPTRPPNGRRAARPSFLSRHRSHSIPALPIPKTRRKLARPLAGKPSAIGRANHSK